MFINLEKCKLKLYDLQVLEGMDDITNGIIINSSYEEKYVETSALQVYREGYLDGDIMIKDLKVEQTLYLYELLLNKGDEKLKTKLLDLKKYLDIYEMNVGKLPILTR